MNPKTTLLAAIVLVALGTYIYFYEREPVEPDSDSELEEVFEVDSELFNHIEIKRAEGETLELEKDGDAWQLVAPVETATDSTEVDTLIRNIANLERQRIIAEGETVSLADFGLDEPEVEVVFRTRDEDGEAGSHGFLIGDETPTGTNRYAKLLGDDKVFVVSSYLKGNFDKEAWDLRDKKVLALDPDKVEKVILRNPEGELILARQGEDRWNVTTPSFCRADRYKASSLVSRFESAKMEEIVSDRAEDLERYGLAQPSHEVEFQLSGDEPVRLLVGDEQESGYYAMNPDRPLVYLVGSSIVDDIKKDASEFRSKRLFDYATYQVSKFQISPAGEPSRTYEKVEGGEDEEDKWVEIEPEKRDWDRSKVEDLLYKMNGTDAEDFVEVASKDPNSLGLTPPAFTITVWPEEGDMVEELTVGKPEGEWVYGRRKGDDPVLKVKASDWEAIEKLMDFEAEPEEEEAEEAK
jgi:hypothetical protein